MQCVYFWYMHNWRSVSFVKFTIENSCAYHRWVLNISLYLCHSLCRIFVNDLISSLSIGFMPSHQIWHHNHMHHSLYCLMWTKNKYKFQNRLIKNYFLDWIYLHILLKAFTNFNIKIWKEKNFQSSFWRSIEYRSRHNNSHTSSITIKLILRHVYFSNVTCTKRKLTFYLH